MSGILQILLISFSLAIDAFSVSVADGMRPEKTRISRGLKIAAYFGGFQAGMPIIGFLIGSALRGFILSIDHWIAFVLLTSLGINMIHESLSNRRHRNKDILDTRSLLMQAVATSIDALIVGITLSLLATPFVISIATIGIVTFTLSVVGYMFGKELCALFGRRIEIVGGVALILIGLKILIEHVRM